MKQNQDQKAGADKLKSITVCPQSSQAEIAVLGGGLAGSEALRLLGTTAATATLYEARDRLGGRIFTSKSAEGIVAEHGATFINAWDDYLISLCKKTGVELFEDKSQRSKLHYAFELAGKFYGAEALSNEAGILQRTCDKDKEIILKEIGREGRPNAHQKGPRSCELDRISAQQYLDNIDGLSKPFKDALALQLACDLGRELHELSANCLVFYEFDPNQSLLRVKGGSSEIISGLTQGLHSHIELGHPVEMMRHTAAGRVEIKFAGKSASEIADAAVIAMPFSTLRDVDISGLNLDQSARDAIAKTAYSHHSKMMILPVNSEAARTRQTEMQLASSSAGGLVWEENSAANRDLGALTLFSGGDRAKNIQQLAQGEISERVALIMSLSSRIIPGIEKFTPQAVIMDWSNEQFSKGGYAADLTGDGTSLRCLVQPGELKGDGALVFAGEHIGNGKARNHMNAAAESAKMATDAIKRRFKL